MPLVKSALIQALKDMPDDSSGVGDSIGVAITQYTTTMFPIVAGPLKSTADRVFIEALNKSNFSTPFPPILGAALDVYKIALSTIIPIQNTGFVATPPPAPATPLIRPIFTTPQPKDVFAQNFANVLHSWFKTGTWVTPVAGGNWI
jgi:hypothetical protein